MTTGSAAPSNTGSRKSGLGATASAANRADMKQSRTTNRTARLIQFSSTTTTDFDGSTTVRVSPVISAPLNTTGFTASGTPNVLCVFIAGPVSTRPVADFAVTPLSWHATVTDTLGSQLANERWIFPDLSR